MVWGQVAAMGLSAAAGIGGAHKATTNRRLTRKRQSKSLKYGKSLYNHLANQGLDQMRRNVSEQRAATTEAKRHIQNAEVLGVQDINSMLAKQMASMRTGVGGAVAGSTAFSGGAQRGAISDTMARLLQHRQGAAGQLAGVTERGAARMGSARDALNRALTGAGQFRYGMQQDMAEVYGGGFRGGNTPQSGGTFDFGGLGAMMNKWGSNSGGPSGWNEAPPERSDLDLPD